MAVYAIGDVQGCYAELQLLLEKISYNNSEDILWFAGDLVNRGPGSLAVLRFVKSLGAGAVVVLGNHDLHLLAVAAGCAKNKPSDTLEEILSAPDREELLDWLRFQPLIYHDKLSGFTLVHAGLPPQWGLIEAQSCAQEVETILRSADYQEFFKHMYGNKPNLWSTDLTGWGRKRFIVNCFSRLRYCDASGKLSLNEKGQPGSQAKDCLPWFEVSNRLSKEMKIIFGHWSTLRSSAVSEPGIFPTDTGCVWGGELTALKLQGKQLQEKPEYINVPCEQIKSVD
ncbi:MAG: symmetrical bis(5'-nucleosyl)-tetraphosphatase [Gammaproteobacteria bacterium]|nr:symmetrical bis(5'-nucleosyl)-tetraphosphatase [Gammaproteobacteria bacterium]